MQENDQIICFLAHVKPTSLGTHTGGYHSKENQVTGTQYGGAGGGELDCGVTTLSYQHIHRDSEAGPHLVILRSVTQITWFPSPQTAEHPGVAE